MNQPNNNKDIMNTIRLRRHNEHYLPMKT